MIAQRNLSLLSNRLAKAGGPSAHGPVRKNSRSNQAHRRLPEAVLERDYCLAWFLVGLSREKLGCCLAFKGGTAIKRCYFGDYRFSEDLDFTLTEETAFEKIRQELEPVFKEVYRASGIVFRFVREDRRSHANSYTFYMGYEGPLPVTADGKEVKVDVTIREELVFPVANRKVLKGYDEYEDLPQDAKVRVYSLDEIAVEKVVALLDRARNEPRDLYDVWYLVTEGHVKLSPLVDAVKQKLAFRGKKLADVRGELRAKEARFRKLWSTRLAAQMVTLPEMEGVYRSVQRAFRQASL